MHYPPVTTASLLLLEYTRQISDLGPLHFLLLPSLLLPQHQYGPALTLSLGLCSNIMFPVTSLTYIYIRHLPPPPIFPNHFPCVFLHSTYHWYCIPFIYHLFTVQECEHLLDGDCLFALFTVVSQCQEQCLAHSRCSINTCLMNKQYYINFEIFILNPIKSWKSELENISPKFPHGTWALSTYMHHLLSGTLFPLIFLR